MLRGLRKGGVVVDMTTSNPSLAREIAEEATKVGCYAVDAPVSGGDIGAREARLSIMIGGDADVVQSIHPLFSVMGKNIRHMGPPGTYLLLLLLFCYFLFFCLFFFFEAIVANLKVN